ncbi:hypothetical protein CEXT_5231 [Caerostris extrusa]|uniref:Ankyrin repeat domain-containing protein n=1 Tax=Caerostris extrusa TaxID=172846 RepID=A0AAV4WHY8_CAEEX|nr:hypothetical protein CEXT_5231 [Caerostris extrusa]
MAPSRFNFSSITATPSTVTGIIIQWHKSQNTKSRLSCICRNKSVLMEALQFDRQSSEIAVLQETCEKRKEEILSGRPRNENALCIYDAFPLHEACKGGCVPCTEFLLNMGTDVHTLYRGKTPLHEACQQNECVELLVKYGANVDAVCCRDLTPLNYACRTGSVACTELLLKNGANIHTPEGICEPLNDACAWDQVGCAEMLIKYGANILNGTESPLFYTCLEGNVKCTELLLRLGADVNTPDFAPLHVACEQNKVECAMLLIQYGANINAVDSENRTPLILACGRRFNACVELLVKIGADLNFQSNEGTALHASCFRGCPEHTALLVRAGANIDANYLNQGTPLYAATFAGEPLCARILLQTGILKFCSRVV